MFIAIIKCMNRARGLREARRTVANWNIQWSGFDGNLSAPVKNDLYRNVNCAVKALKIRYR